ncbi:hypothetical protein T492DRAFT_1128387 [Pavlovales sp. CCMP2436]|nr:hypothetical protein T492DRAFT_1128387 [Pavlovales sp. CCMP2436]
MSDCDMPVCEQTRACTAPFKRAARAAPQARRRLPPPPPPSSAASVALEADSALGGGGGCSGGGGGGLWSEAVAIEVGNGHEVGSGALPLSYSWPGFKLRHRVSLFLRAHGATAAERIRQVTFTLHPTFKVASKTLRDPPFAWAFAAWGEFSARVDVVLAQPLGVAGGSVERVHTFWHDVSFDSDGLFEVLCFDAAAGATTPLPAPHDADGPRQSIQHARAHELTGAYVLDDTDVADALPAAAVHA